MTFKTLKFIFLFLLSSTCGHVFSQSNPIVGTSETLAVKIDTFANGVPFSTSFELPQTTILSPLPKTDSLGRTYFDTIRTESVVIKGYSSVEEGIKGVKINGDPVKMFTTEYWEHLIYLYPGENLIEIETTSQSGVYSLDTIVLNHVPPEVKNYILAIAANKYDHFPSLANPLHDAKTICRVLTDKYQFEKSRIFSLFNEDFTLENLDQIFRLLIKTITKYDNLVIYVAAHGHYDEVLDEGYWIPPAGRVGKPTDFLSNSSILKYIAALKARHVLLLSDACYSGSIYLQERGIKPKGQVNKSESVYDRVYQKKSRTLISSGGKEKVSDSYKGGRESPFCHFLRKFLEENQQNRVLESDLAQYLLTSVGRNTNHTPIAAPLKGVGDEGGELVFHRKDIK